MKQKQSVTTIPLSNGLNTSTDDKVAPIDSLSKAENVSIDKLGRLSKRNGFRRIPTELIGNDGTTTQTFGLHAFDDFVKSDGDQLLSYVATRGKWKAVGRCPHIFSRLDNVSSTGFDQRNPASATVDDLTWYAYEQNNQIRLTIKDDESLQNVVGDKLISSGTRPILVELNGQVILVFSSGTTVRIMNLNLAKIMNDDLSLATPALEGLDGAFDACANGANLLVAYSSSGNTNFVRYDSTFNLVSLTNLSQVSDVALDLTSDSLLNAYVSSISNSSVTALSVLSSTDSFVCSTTALSMSLPFGTLPDPNPSGTSTFPEIKSGQRRFVSGNMLTGSVVTCIPHLTGAVLFSEADKVVYSTNVNFNLGHATASSSTVLSMNASLVSKPFIFDGNSLIAVAMTSSLLSSNIILDTNDGFEVGRCNVLSAGTRASSSLATYDSGGHLALERSSLFPPAADDTVTIATLGAFGVGSLSLQSDVQQSVKFHDNLHIPGSIMRSYDGQQAFETGFFIEPEIIDVRVVPSGTLGLVGSIPIGTYVYAFTYESIDAKGQVHESAPSIFRTVQVLTNNSSVAFYVSSLNQTQRTNVRIVGYRSSNRVSDLGNQIPFKQFTSNVNVVQSVRNSLGNVIIDNKTDASISSNKPLYTVANERGNFTLDNFAPPSCKFMAVYGNRAFVQGTDDDNKLFFSKFSVAGEPLNFSRGDDLSVTVSDDDNETVTAISSLDDSLVIFKPTRIYSLTGQGPNNQLEGDLFADPVPVSTAIGCDEPNSINFIAAGGGQVSGLTFKSREGIYLLDRGLNTSYIGQNVRDFDGLTIVKSVHVPANDEIRFMTSVDDAIVFNYRLNQWTTWTNSISTDGVLVGDQFYYSKPDGTILAETEDQYDDDGVSIRIKVQTPWISLAGTQGFAYVDRIWLLGERKGSHTLRMSVGFDNAEGYDGTFVEDYDVDQVLQPAVYEDVLTFDQPFNRYSFGMQTGKKCSSFRVLIEDIQVEQGSFNEGLTLSAINVVSRQMPGLERLAPSQRGKR